MSAADIVILVLAAVAVIAGVSAAVWRHKHGKHSCGGDCAHCGGCSNTDKERR